MARCSVQYDSRRVMPGDVFVAMRGRATDGNRFAGQALERGARLIVTDSLETFSELTARGVAAHLVANGRRALAELAAENLGHPERSLSISAVTGTNGKTTTAFLLEQMLRSIGRRCVLLGTIETHVGDEVRPSEHTTPEASDVLQTFADGIQVGATEAVMEMSSHALEQERTWGFPVDVAIFTNLTQDHLDYHGSMEAYAAAKSRLFAGVGAGEPRVAVVNTDDESSGLMLKAAQRCREVWTYGLGRIGQAAPYRAEQIVLNETEILFDFVTPQGTARLRCGLCGRVNVYNLLAVSCAALARGLSLDQVVRGAATLKQVPGRFQTVDSGETGIRVIVDYAHTDDALRNLITLAREVVGADQRVIAVFGCGGDRDRGKRAKMGRVAAKGSDLIVLTSDNPRSEEPLAIIEEIRTGIEGSYPVCLVEEDRAGAIGIAIRAASRGDIVLIAGKGHEKMQIFADGAVPFDDVVVAEAVLRDL